MLHEFRMPDAGEGLTEAEVLSWRVTVGDTVSVNQVLLEVETAKAAVELPSPYAGTVVALLAKPGEVVPVGQPIIQIDDGVVAAAGAGGPASGSPGEAPPRAPAPVPEPGPTAEASATTAQAEPVDAEPQAGTRQAVLVGYGVRPQDAPRRRPRG